MHGTERTSSRIFFVLLAFVVTFGVAVALSAQQPRDERFTATIASLAGGGTAPAVIHINHYSSDADVEKLKDLLANKGPDALRDALWDLEADISASAAASAIPSPSPGPSRTAKAAG